MASFAGLPVVDGGGRGKATASAGTRIRVLVPGKINAYTYITHLVYEAGALDHTLTFMTSASDSIAASALAESGTALIVRDVLLDASGNTIAASDVVAVALANGDWHLTTVSSYNSDTKTITLADAVPANTGGILKGGKVCCYGVHTDTGHANYQFATVADAVNRFPAQLHDGPLVRSAGRYEPIVIDSDNSAFAGKLHSVNWVFA